MNFKSRLYNFPDKVKYKLSDHAKLRLKERFGLDSLGKIYCNQIEHLESYSWNKKCFYWKDKDMVLIRNKNSRTIITVLTPEMWNEKEFEACWKESINDG